MPTAFVSGSGPGGPNRPNLAREIAAIFFKWKIVISYIRAKYPNISSDDAEDIEMKTFEILLVNIIEGRVTVLDGIDRFDQIAPRILNACIAYARGIVDHLSLTQLRKNKRYVSNSLEILEMETNKKAHALPSFSQFARRGLEIAKDVLSPSQLMLIKLRRRGLTYEKIALQVAGNHDRNWVSQNVKRSYGKIATLFVAHLDPDFLAAIRATICRDVLNQSQNQERSPADTGPSDQQKKASDSRSDESLVADFIERIVDHAGSQKNSNPKIEPSS